MMSARPAHGPLSTLVLKSDSNAAKVMRPGTWMPGACADCAPIAISAST